MDEVCVSYGDKLVCTEGEMLILVAMIELLIYVVVFWGGWSILKYFLIKKNRQQEESEWNPPNFK